MAKTSVSPVNGGLNVPWLPSTTKSLKDNDIVIAISSVANYKHWDSAQVCAAQLENGINIVTTSNPLYFNHRIYVSFDINGKKPPNRLGKDTFSFGITETGPTPRFVFNTATTYSYSGDMCFLRCVNGYSGSPYSETCSEKLNACVTGTYSEEREPLVYVLKHGKLPDLSKVK